MSINSSDFRMGQNIEDTFMESIKKKDTKKIENIFSATENKSTLLIKVKAEKLLDELLSLVDSFVSVGQKRVLINISNNI